MSKQLVALLSLVIFASLGLIAIRSWRKRSSGQAAEFSEPLEALEYFGELLAQAKGLYVATTYASNHLERISAYGLGSRGVANIFVFTEGLLIIRTGERPLAIDKTQISGIQLTQATIDKAVEAKGLLSVSWLQGQTQLATQIRIVDNASRLKISNAISGITAGSEQREVIK